MAIRHDRSQLKTRKTDAGYLRADGRLTRAGVFLYDDAEGNIVRELRHPDEVFDPKSLDSLRLVPVTDGHPALGVSSKSASQHTRGSTGNDVRQDGNFVASTVMIHDHDLIAKAESGTQELSCGYVCDLDFTPGVWNGEKYDAVQKNIRYNHVAVVPKGRAGSEVRLRMDGDDVRAMTATLDTTAEVPKMSVKIKIGAHEIDVDPKVADDFKASQDASAARIRELETQVSAKAEPVKVDHAKADAEKARADALQSKLDEYKKGEQSRFETRLALHMDAAELLGDDFDNAKAAKMSARDIQALCIAELAPSLKLDGKSDDYVATAYETLMAQHDDGVDESVAAVRIAAGDKKTSAKADAPSPREAMIARNAGQLATQKKGA